MNDNDITQIVGWPTLPEMVKFRAVAAAAIAEEREACAAICEEEYSIEGIAERCANKIRARSKD